MSAALDVLDILDLDEASPKKAILDKEALLARTDKRKGTRTSAQPKRPEHVPREVWGLQSSLNNELPPIMPTDDTPVYKQPKAVIGVGRVRRWYWVPFTNSARQDNLVLNHWRQEKPDSETEKDYYFARFNKHVTVPEYTKEEYESLLKDAKWSEERTAYLLELAKRFDLRFIHMRDRWDVERFPNRPSIEDLKERYYGILTQLDKARGTNLSQGLRYDAAHERRRKQQLSLLYGRTKEQVEEEQCLILELRKIEARRRERERKKQDLQKLISLADNMSREPELTDFNSGGADFSLSDETISTSGQRKRPGLSGMMTNSGISNQSLINTNNNSNSNTGLVYSHGTGDSCASLASLVNNSSTGGAGGVLSTNDLNTSLTSVTNTATLALNANYVINFVDASKNPGVHLRSQKMKLPSNLGQKKIRIIENFLAHLQIDPSPPATGEIVEAYNNLRSKILLLYDLRIALLHCDYELHSARMRLETFAPNQPLPNSLATLPAPGTADSGDAAGSTIDSTILAALRVADSKRPVLPRHSLGVAGALAAAGGSLSVSTNSTPITTISSSASLTATLTTTNTDHLVNVASSSSFNNDDNSNSSMGTDHIRSSMIPHSSTQSSISAVGSSRSLSDDTTCPSQRSDSECSNLDGGSGSRRRRAAAVEQGRVLKKLKIKGQLVD